MNWLRLLIVLLIAGCTPSSRITGSWKSEKSHPVHNVFIAALTGNTVAKSTLENDLEHALMQFSVACVKSINEFPPTFMHDSVPREEIINTVLRKGNEAILTITILKKETESRYAGGPYAPVNRYPYYGTFWGYYNYWTPSAYDPGYYTTNDVYYLETNLYDSRTENLMWSAQSETYSYSGLTAFSKTFAKMITAELKKNNLIH
jgi:hypothetical protein